MQILRIIALAIALAWSPAAAQTNPGTSPLSIAKGGTGANTAAGARSSLGLAIGSATQAWDADLDAISALSGTNTIYYRSGAGAWSAVTIGSFLSFSAGTLNIGDAELTALGGLTSANNKCFYWTGSGTAANYDCSSFGRSVANAADAAALRVLAATVIGTDVQAYNARLAGIAGFASTANRLYGADGSGNASLITLPAAGLSLSAGAIALANDLAAIEALSSTGFAVRTASDTWAQRSLAAPAAGFTITNPAGVAGDPTFVLANDLAALEGLASTGFAARTTTDTWAQRTLQPPAAGITITNPAGVAGDPTLALANDLAALEGLSGTGIARRTGTDAWSVGTTVSVAEGGSGLTSGTSGGVLCFTGTTTAASSALLTQYGILYGGGAGACPVAMAAGTDGQIIVGQSGAAPLWKTISGDLTVSAAGAMTIGATKVTSAHLNADVFSTAHSWAGVQTLASPIFTGSADSQGAVFWSGDISPSQLVANTNDWAPTGFSGATAVRLSTDASRNITGLAGGADGRMIILHNVGSFDAVLINNSVLSSAANRFFIAGDITLPADNSITLRYDATSTAWRAITTPGSGGGGGSLTSVTIAAGAGVAVAGTCTVTTSGTCTVAVDGAFGLRNRVINPSGQINQGGTSTAADGAYWFDQWVHLNQSNPVTPSQLTNAENGTPYMIRTTQSNASAQRFGIIQPIESANIIDVRGQTVTLSARVRMSASTTLRYAIVEWTGTADSVTKDVVNDWTSGTFTTGNFFVSTTTTICGTGSTALTASTFATVSLSCAVSGSMNNLHVFFWTDSTQAQNVTLDVGKVQLEMAAAATPLAVRPRQVELMLCQRYYQTLPGFIVLAGGSQGGNSLPVAMRIAPTVTGGGTGFATNGFSDGQTGGFSQNVRGSQNLVADARL